MRRSRRPDFERIATAVPLRFRPLVKDVPRRIIAVEDCMDFYGLYGSSARLGLEEGQARLDCPPGTVKVYLQEFPWERCVPESELTEPVAPTFPEAPVPTEEVPALPAPEPLPEPLPEPPPEPQPEYRPPGKARFLDIDAETGEILDPDTGEHLPIDKALIVTPVEGVATGIGVLAVTALVLTALGVFGGK